MSLDKTLNDVFTGLLSDRVTERRKNVELLKELLGGTSTPHLLSEKHRNASGLSWKDFLFRVHELILKESEKFDSGRTSTHDNVKSHCSSLLINVISGANKNNCFIDCDKILEICTDVLKSARLLKAFGEAYVTLLNKHVLPVQHYLENLTPYQWADLLELATELCSSSAIDRSITVRMVMEVMKNGSPRCHLILPIRDSLTSITSLFVTDNNERQHHLQENLLEIAILVLENVASESRLALCVFTENIIPHAMKFYDQTSDAFKNKKKLLFRLLYLSMIIHHPGGRVGKEAGCLAKDWTAWDACLIAIDQLVMGEAAFLKHAHGKRNIHSSHSQSELCPDFLALSVEIYHLFFKGFVPNQMESNNVEGNPPKRSRIDRNEIRSVQQLLIYIPENFFPWLSFLGSYVTKYGHTISVDEKSEIFKTLGLLIVSEKSDLMCLAALKTISALLDVIISVGWSETYFEASEFIWKTCVRKVSTSSSVFDQCHNVIQSFLRIDGFDGPINSLVKLYSERTMPHSYGSLFTLMLILSKFNNTIIDTNTRIQICNWVFVAYRNNYAQCVVASVLFQICVMENVNFIPKELQPEKSFLNSLFDSHEAVMLVSDFESGLLVDDKGSKEEKFIEKQSLTTWDKSCQQIVEFLCANMKADESKSIGESIPFIIIDCDIILRFVSYFIEYSIIESAPCISTLKSNVCETFDMIAAYLPDHFKSLSGPSNVKHITLKNSKWLFATDHYSADIALMVRQKTPKELVESFCLLANESNDSMQVDGFDFMGMNSGAVVAENLTKMAAIEVLVNYSMLDSDFRIDALQYILSPDMFDFQIKNDFQIAVNAISSILSKNKTDAPISLILRLMQVMCRQLFRDGEATSQILTLLYDLLEPVVRSCDNVSRENCLIILRSYLQRCKSHYYSPKVMGQVFKCILWMQTKSDGNNWGGELDDTFMDGLSSSLHCLRLYSCYCIGHIMRDTSIKQYDDLIEVLLEMFKVDAADLTEDVISDEGVNRTSTVFHCLASVAVISPVWDKSSLFTILKIAHEKNISPRLLKSVFHHVSQHLKISSIEKLISYNMDVLISSWLKNRLPLDKFPYQLVDCDSKDVFYSAYRETIIPLDMYWSHGGKMSPIIEQVSHAINQSNSDIITSCLPQLLALALPLIAVDNKRGLDGLLPSKAEIVSAKNLYTTVCNQLGDSMKTLITQDIVKIIFLVLKRVCDPKFIKIDLGWSGALPSGMQLNKDSYTDIIMYLNATLDIDIMFHLCLNNPAGIQEMLQMLWGEIISQITLERKLLSLEQYWTFCQMLPQRNSLNPFIYSFIIRNMLHLISAYQKQSDYSYISVAACWMLKSLFQKVLSTEEFSTIVSPHLPLIVYTISQIETVKIVGKEISLEILNFLLIDMQHHFGAVMKTLDPLPNFDLFENINKNIKNAFAKPGDSLYKHIDNFLNGGVLGRFEGLKLLHRKLKSSKEELAALFEKFKDSRGFSEDCVNSLLHRLASNLLQIASEKNDKESSLQACRCLGELGVSDYQTIVLQPPFTPNLIIEKHPIQYLAYLALSQIKDLVFDSDPKVIAAASEALKSLLLFKEGFVALEILTEKSDNSVRDFLIPFMSQKKTFATAKVKIASQAFESLAQNTNLWFVSADKRHSDWVVDLTTGILDVFAAQNCFLHSFVGVCKLKPRLAQKLLPPLVGLIHLTNNNHVLMMQRQVKNFFKRYYEATFVSLSGNDIFATQSIPNGMQMQNGDQAKAIGKIETESVKCMLELVQFIMLQKTHYPSNNKSWMSDDGDTLDYLTIAWAACSTGSYFAAIYYGELWCSSQLHESPPSNPEKISNLPCGENMLSILRKSYLAIGDGDAINGCGSAHLLDPAERRKHYMRNGSFTDALLMHDLVSAREKNNLDQTVVFENEDAFASSYNSSNSCSLQSDRNIMSERSFAQSLQMSHLYHLAGKYMDACGSSRMLDDMKYESFWRLGNWSLIGNTSYLKTKNCSANSNSGLSKLENCWPGYQYVCLKKVLTQNIQKNDAGLQESLRDAREYITVNFIQKSIESCQSFYELATKLQTLEEIEYYAKANTEKRKGSIAYSNYFNNLFVSWSVNNILPFNNFKHLEPILAQRIVMLKHLSNELGDVNSKISCAELQLDYAEFALSNDCIQAGTRWIDSASCAAETLLKSHRSNAEHLPDCVSKLVGLVRLAEGKAAWKGGHSDVALHLVKSLITNENNIDNVLHANALRQYGSWMVETRSESALDIVNNYLQRSLDLLGVERNNNASVDAYLSIARFTDEEYKQVDSYIKSAAFVNKVKCMERCKVRADGLKEMKQTKNLSVDEKKALFYNDGQSNIDEVEIKNSQAEREQYLQLAIRYYLCTLCISEEHNLCVFRVISLWLNNRSLELDSESEKTLYEYLNAIPSRKFLPLVPQLTPRMSQIHGDPFQEKLYALIERCVLDHPHHTLPVLLAIKHSNKDKEIQERTQPSSQLSTKGEDVSPEEPYVAVARKMLHSLSRRGDAQLSNIIKQTELVSLAMISLANLKLKSAKTTQQVIPRTEPLRNINQQTHVLVPTLTLPVRYDANYQNIPSVVSFSENFFLVGGVNMPKKLFCRGSDGIDRPMLLKGEDDIRQDAVMQQVFVIVNHLLSRNQHTRHRRLIIRTYKVVALSRRSGVIEWCDGTDSLGRLLTGADGTKGYHAKIRPNDMMSKTARELMGSKRTSTNEEKLKVFKKILAKFKPVFHHFFTENFLMPAVWYERKLAYTHSVATSSMIGYILGLGDRHVQNILIDTSTAEVIHIDLGIAFEQGRVQPTPETVPFRLTQDMVAGFGSAGIEGVFRRSCEKTMDVLKQNQETLLTILEVLLCDPLYMWTVIPQKSYQKQNGEELSVASSSVAVTQTIDTHSSGSEAERALLRIQNKLEGSEFGCALATPGQVSRLIQQATDINNLSRLFIGWQPYL